MKSLPYRPNAAGLCAGVDVEGGRAGKGMTCPPCPGGWAGGWRIPERLPIRLKIAPEKNPIAVVQVLKRPPSIEQPTLAP